MHSHVLFVSKADITACLHYVRFTPSAWRYHYLRYARCARARNTKPILYAVQQRCR